MGWLKGVVLGKGGRREGDLLFGTAHLNSLLRALASPLDKILEQGAFGAKGSSD